MSDKLSDIFGAVWVENGLQYLFQRNEVFYFLRRIPANLHGMLGLKKEIRLSLGTRDRKAAKGQVSLLNGELEKLSVARKLKLPDEVIRSLFQATSLCEMVTSEQSAPERLFSDCTSLFLQEKGSRIRADGVRIFREVFSEFRKVLGDRDVAAYTHTDLVRFQTKASQGISVATLNKKIRYLSVFFNWLVTHGKVKLNPCQGMTIRKTVPDHELKKVFSKEDLERWLTSPAFNGETCKHYGPQGFWIPLIAMYSGMRMNEICQLRPCDLRVVDGIPVFDINQDEGRLLKNLSSIRLVPIHPVLLSLGILEYGKEREGMRERLLFPVKFMKENRPDYSFSVQKYIRKYITQDKRKSFHSFRHTFADRLKQAMVQAEVISELLGHALPSISMNRYGKKYIPATLLEAVSKIDYGLSNISSLKTISWAGHPLAPHLSGKK